MTHDTLFNKKIRFHIIWSLVFFFLFHSCSENKKEVRSATIQWEGHRAGSMIIPKELLPEIPKDSIEQLLHIQLASSNVPILGEYTITNDAVIFRPLIAFTHGLKYEVRWASKLLTEIEVTSNDPHSNPEVVSIYPTRDTVPLNLLKIYISFSKPMQEGQALKNIAVIKDRRDTIPSVFLDLQPELWNKERTVLTLWLDPGRIKRDLQPNIKMGAPLQYGVNYQLLINQDWQDAEGDLLAKPFSKDFIVGVRDSLSPDPQHWLVHAPKAGSRQPLKIELNESLDYVLLKNAIRIIDMKGNFLDGLIEMEAEETILNFTPSNVWSPGDYALEIESRLEDLAGNNLNRLFDKDISRQNTSVEKEIHKRSFHVK